MLRSRYRFGLVMVIGWMAAVVLVAYVPADAGAPPTKLPSGTSRAPILNPAAYSTSVVADGPTLFYRLDESFGSTAADSSGFGRNATYNPLSTFALGMTSALASDSDSAVTGAKVVNTSSAGVPQGNADRSVEIWFRTTGSGGLVSWGPRGSGQKFSVSLGNTNTGGSAPTKITVDGWGPNYVFDAGRTWSDNSWHYLVTTYAGASNSATLYLDGLQLGAHSLGGTLATGFDAGGLTFGGGDGVDAFFGSMDEAAIYAGVLTPTQVQAHFAASGDTRPGAPTSLSVAAAGANALSVSWAASTAIVPSGQSDVSGYRVTAVPMSGATGPATAVDGTTTSAVLRGMAGGMVYTVRVEASNGFGSSPGGVSATVTALGSQSTYAAAVRADSPSVYYRTDDVSGSRAADSSGFGRDAAYGDLGSKAQGIPGALAADPDLAVSGAMLINRSGSGIPIGNADRSVEVWIKTASGSTGTVASWGPRGNGLRFSIVIASDSVIRVEGWNDDYAFPSTRPVADNAWHHLVVTYDGSSAIATVYLDAKVVGAHALPSPLSTGFDALGLTIGGADCCYLTSSSLDEAAVYPTVLTRVQVANHFYAATGRSEGALT